MKAKTASSMEHNDNPALPPLGLALLRQNMVSSINPHTIKIKPPTVVTALDEITKMCFLFISSVSHTLKTKTPQVIMSAINLASKKL